MEKQKKGFKMPHTYVILLAVIFGGISFVKIEIHILSFLLDHKHSHCRYRQKRYEGKGFAFFIFTYLVYDTHNCDGKEQTYDIRRKSSLPAKQERKGC